MTSDESVPVKGNVDPEGSRSVLANWLCAAFSGVIITIIVIIIIKAADIYWGLIMFQKLSWEHDTVEATDRTLWESLKPLLLTLLGCQRFISRHWYTSLVSTSRQSDWFSPCAIAKIKYINFKHGYLFSWFEFMPANSGTWKRNNHWLWHHSSSIDPTAKRFRFHPWLCGLSFLISKMGCKTPLHRLLMTTEWVNMWEVIRTVAAALCPQYKSWL